MSETRPALEGKGRKGTVRPSPAKSSASGESRLDSALLGGMTNRTH